LGSTRILCREQDSLFEGFSNRPHQAKDAFCFSFGIHIIGQQIEIDFIVLSSRVVVTRLRRRLMVL
jgi:hypothetical protein